MKILEILLMFGMLSQTAIAASCPKAQKREVTSTQWVIKLECRTMPDHCYAASSGSYGDLNAAKRFETQSAAKAFTQTKNFTIRQSIQRIEQITETIVVCGQLNH